jgi:hypothetical protein
MADEWEGQANGPYTPPRWPLHFFGAGRDDAHPEKTCQSCGGPNPRWSADSAWWNEVVGSPNGILCPTCFVFRAGTAFGIKPSSPSVVQQNAPSQEVTDA